MLITPTGGSLILSSQADMKGFPFRARGEKKGRGAIHVIFLSAIHVHAATRLYLGTR